MLSNTFRQIKTAILQVLIFTILTGLIYPVIVTGLAQLLFPWQANGSLVEHQGKMIGSLLIGQSFTESKYFWSRPSATDLYPYNAEASMGSNMSPSNPAYLSIIKNRIANLQTANPQSTGLIPVDLVTASASGLDPDISPQAALYQAPRIAAARGVPLHEIQILIMKLIQKPSLHLFGEYRVNVLQLNLALDHLRIRKEYH